MHFKQLKDLPSIDVHQELEQMLHNNVLSWQHMNQICINATVDNDNPYAGVGSLDLDWARASETENGIHVPKRETALREQDFTELCSVFVGTQFEQLYTILTDNYTVGRVRLMRSEPRYAMTWHYDYNNRIHYPIKTQFGCFMVIEKQIEHLEKNKWYWTETNQCYHTAFNGSNEDRIHMVACIL
jgi:hypothetical protein